MKDKNIKNLLVILVILILVWFGKNTWDQKKQIQNSVDGQIDLPLNSNQVNKIEINLTENVMLQKRDNIWFVQVEGKNLGDDRAKAEDVDALLNLLEPTKIKLISNNANKHKDLGLDNTDSGTIKFYDNVETSEPKLILLVSRENSQLFRQDQMANVYEWSSDLSRIVTQVISSWVAPIPTPTATQDASSSAF